MQELALHVEHFKIRDVEGICKENTRTAEHYRNKVDFSLSSGNYLAYSGDHVDRKNYTMVIKDILKNNCCHYEKRRARGGRGGRPRSVLVYNDTGKAIRDDANYMSSVVVTISRDTVAEWGEKRVKEFFRCCSYFLEKRYGFKIDDVVHVDERAAGIHMHYNFVPLVDGRLNADKLFKRNTLKALHTEFAIFLKERGFDIVRGLEGGKKEYYRTIAELKKKQAKLEALTDIDGNKLSDICNGAEFLKASSSFLGFGENKPARYVFNAKDAKTLVDMAEAGIAAAEVLAGYKDNNDTIRSLQEENAELRSELQAEKENSKAMAAEAAEQARAEVLEKNKHYIHNGKVLEPILPYKDIVDKVSELVAEARKRTKERKIQEDRARALAKKRVYTKGRDDDYSL